MEYEIEFKMVEIKDLSKIQRSVVVEDHDWGTNVIVCELSGCRELIPVSGIRYLAGFFTQTGNCIVKTAGRYSMFITPCSISQTTLPALDHQIHQFLQGAPWCTFVTHNETSKCSKFLSPIKRSVVKIYLLLSL